MLKTRFLNPISKGALAVLFMLSLQACAGGGDEDSLENRIDAFNETEKYTIELNTMNQETGMDASIFGEFDGNKEYVKIGDDEYYRHVQEDRVTVYGRNNGDWTSQTYDLDSETGEDSFDSLAAVYPGNIAFNWFDLDEGDTYMLKEAHYDTMFGESLRDSVTECSLRPMEDGFKVFYTLHTDRGPIDYLIEVTAIDDTSLELPETS